MRKILCMCLIVSVLVFSLTFGTVFAADVSETVYDFTSLGEDGIQELIESEEITIKNPNSGSWSIDGNGLKLVATANNNIDEDSYVNLFQFGGSGDYTAIAKVDANADTNTSSSSWKVHTGLTIHADKDNYLIFGIGSQKSGYIVSRSKINGELKNTTADYFDMIRIGDKATDQGDIWLKIEKTGDVYNCYYSLDGTTYIPAIQNYTFANTSAKLGIYSGSSSTANPIEGIFKTLTIARPKLMSVDVDVNEDGIQGLIESEEITIKNPNSGSWSIDGNGLKLVAAANNNIDEDSYVNLFQFGGSGDYTAIAKVDANADTNTSSSSWKVHTGLTIHADKDNYLIFGIGSQKSGYIVSRSKINGELKNTTADYFDMIKIGDKVADQGDIWLKIEKTGDVYNCYYSLDGTTYIPAIQNYTFANTSAKLGIYSGSSSTANPIEGIFKTLTITQDSSVKSYDFTKIGEVGLISSTIVSSYETVGDVIFVTYATDGRMIGCEVKKNVNIAVGNNDIEAENLKGTGANLVKVLVLSNMNTLVPLCVPGEFN